MQVEQMRKAILEGLVPEFASTPFTNQMIQQQQQQAAFGRSAAAAGQMMAVNQRAAVHNGMGGGGMMARSGGGQLGRQLRGGHARRRQGPRGRRTGQQRLPQEHQELNLNPSPALTENRMNCCHDDVSLYINLLFCYSCYCRY
jgi:hypothetical protein